MNTKKQAKRMLWIGITLIVTSAVATIALQMLIRGSSSQQQLQQVLATPLALLFLAGQCGCAFVAVSFPMRALHGRQLSVLHQRSLATFLLTAGVACVAIGVASTPVITGISQFLLLSNTGQDLLSVLGPVLFPVFSNAIPTIGIVLIPTSYLQRIIERDATTREQIFTGRVSTNT